MRNIRRPIGNRLTAGLLVPLALFLAACSLDEILEVEIPGRVAEGDLNNPALAQTLVNGAIGDFECGWDEYVAGASLHSDEWFPTSGNLRFRNWGARKNFSSDGAWIEPCGNWAFQIYQTLQTASFQSNDVYDRLAGFDAADVPNASSLQGTVRAYGGFALVGLGEGFCRMAIEGGPALTSTQVLAEAEAKFSEALTLAGGDPDISAMATIGRARARLGQGNYSGAMSDAAQVPAGYVKTAFRSNSEARLRNNHVQGMNDPDDAVSKHGTLATDYRNLSVAADGTPMEDGSGTDDPRVNAMNRGELGFDFATDHWYHDKIVGRAAPTTIARSEEAELIMAEAQAQSGNLQGAIDIINSFHNRHGLPVWGGSADGGAVLDHVIEERRRTLFAEGAHRFWDHIRFRGTPNNVPFLGEAGSVHPNGLDQSGDTYGPITCFPLPDVEVNGNTNISG